ncbi:hypothetical protein TSUD_109170 [Trifolium subterraneum]|nr:hypothetical protein TSUD_109170 [Trifolium subterraneum]
MTTVIEVKTCAILGQEYVILDQHVIGLNSKPKLDELNAELNRTVTKFKTGHLLTCQVISLVLYSPVENL